MPAFAAKIGVPVNPKRLYFLNARVMSVCMSPNCDRWHSSKMITAWPENTAWPLFALMNVDSFWIVVMMIRVPRSSRRFFSTAVDVFEFAAPFSNRSYSRIVW